MVVDVAGGLPADVPGTDRGLRSAWRRSASMCMWRSPGLAGPPNGAGGGFSKPPAATVLRTWIGSHPMLGSWR